MPYISPLETNHAPCDVHAIYEEFSKRMNFPSAPNFITTQGHSLAATRGTWGLVYNVLVAGEIPRWTKEIIFVAISKDRNCKYCEAAHLACCRMLGVDPGVLEQLSRSVPSIPDPRLREMVQFALRAARDPRSLTETDFGGLRELGLKQSEIVELIAMAGLAVYANIIADATRMESDAMFASVGGAAKTPSASRVPESSMPSA